MENVTVRIEGTIGSFYTDYHINLLRQAFERADGGDVTIEISSPGGDINEALKMYSEIKNYRKTKKGKVTAKYLAGLSASAATIFPLAANEIIASELSMFVLHFGRVAIWNYGYYTAEELEILSNAISKNVRELQKVNDLIVLLYSRKMKNVTEEELRAFLEKDEVMTAFEMKEMGFIDAHYDDGSNIVNKIIANHMQKNEKPTVEPVTTSPVASTEPAATSPAATLDTNSIVAAIQTGLKPTFEALNNKIAGLEEKLAKSQQEIETLRLAKETNNAFTAFAGTGNLPNTGSNGIPPIARGKNVIAEKTQGVKGGEHLF